MGTFQGKAEASAQSCRLFDSQHLSEFKIVNLLFMCLYKGDIRLVCEDGLDVGI